MVFDSTGGGAVFKLSGNSSESRALHQSSTSEKKKKKDSNIQFYLFNFKEQTR